MITYNFSDYADYAKVGTDILFTGISALDCAMSLATQLYDQHKVVYWWSDTYRTWAMRVTDDMPLYHFTIRANELVTYDCVLCNMEDVGDILDAGYNGVIYAIVDDMQVLYSEECAPYLQRFYVENSMGVSLPRVTFDLRIIDADIADTGSSALVDFMEKVKNTALVTDLCVTESTRKCTIRTDKGIGLYELILHTTSGILTVVDMVSDVTILTMINNYNEAPYISSRGAELNEDDAEFLASWIQEHMLNNREKLSCDAALQQLFGDVQKVKFYAVLTRTGYDVIACSEFNSARVTFCGDCIIEVIDISTDNKIEISYAPGKIDPCSKAATFIKQLRLSVLKEMSQSFKEHMEETLLNPLSAVKDLSNDGNVYYYKTMSDPGLLLWKDWDTGDYGIDFINCHPTLNMLLRFAFYNHVHDAFMFVDSPLR